MSNLWEETIEFLKENDKTFEDVLFIQGGDFKVTKENFEIVAKKTKKDGGMRYINHVRVSAGKLVEVSRVMDFYRILEKFDA